ncbi:hypothetical protein [Orenia marismortui]|uniref:hypothetical protein n=1 Tax=Orenia marismortui TaxID=46469 RepID=UPI000379A992|nr:hypothetical protein [Orenia marismortui]
MLQGIGQEYDGDPNNSGTFVANRTFSLTLSDSPDTLEMIIFRSPDADYNSGLVSVTNGQVIISDCP